MSASSPIKAISRRHSNARRRRSGSAQVFPLTVPLPHMSIRESIANRVYDTVSTYSVNAFMTTSNAVQTFANHAFSTADISDFAALAAVFDQFKLNRAQVWIIPRSVSLANPGITVSASDYDDVTNWTTVSQGESFQNSVVTCGYMGHYHDIVPHLAVALYGGAFTQFGNLPGDQQWVDAAAAPFWYGIKMGAEVTTSALIYDLIVRVYVSWRAVR